MIEIILMLETVFLMLFIVMFILFYPSIQREFKLFLAKTKKAGIIYLVGFDFKTKSIIKKIDEEMDISGRKYEGNPEYIIYERGVPTIYFFEGDSRPIDMLKRKGVQVDSKYLNNVVLRAKLLGSIGALTEQKNIKLLLLVAIGGAIAAAAMCFQIQTQISDIQNTLAGISRAITLLK